MASAKYGRGESLVKAVTGKRFGRLTIIRVLPYSIEQKGRPCVCLCDCGVEFIRPWNAIQQGTTQSCGCLRAEAWRTTITEHGLFGTPAWNSWSSMLTRCYNKRDHNYLKYGAKGITVCDRWRESFANFHADMGDRPDGMTLDRFPDRNGNYEPGNCRWATDSQQAANRKSSIMVTIDGRTQCLKDWCRERGIGYMMVYKRIRRGIDPVKALA
jgi:hypothetical protein